LKTVYLAAAGERLQRLGQPFRPLIAPAWVRGGQGVRRFLGRAAKTGRWRAVALHEFNLADGGLAQKGVDPLAQAALFVRQKQRGAWHRAQCQDVAGKLERLGQAGHFGTGHLAPAQHQYGIAKAHAQESPTGGLTGIAADGRWAATPLWNGVLFGGRCSGHGRVIMPANDKKSDLAARLLDWYDIHRRVLPWRAPAGQRGDPYRVWLSEIMLQQTTVQAVAGYYRKFLDRWPDVRSLADAPQDAVLAAWAGLGYYARARNLHAAAKMVANQFGGVFPGSAEALRALPGVGGYTAGAIAAIAFDERQAAMDANAERVIARVFAVETPMPKAKPQLHAHCAALVPARAGDFVQALMDLGSAICTPKRPNCGQCPWQDDCLARRRGIQEQLPVKAPKMARPLKRGAAFVATDRSGAVLLVKRPDTGLLASMLEPPQGVWGAAFPPKGAALKQAPFPADWVKRSGLVRHGFTHFELEIEVYATQVAKRPKTRGNWVPRETLRDVALPTVMRKIVEHGLDEGGPLFAPPRAKSAKART